MKSHICIAMLETSLHGGAFDEEKLQQLIEWAEMNDEAKTQLSTQDTDDEIVAVWQQLLQKQEVLKLLGVERQHDTEADVVLIDGQRGSVGQRSFNWTVQSGEDMLRVIKHAVEMGEFSNLFGSILLNCFEEGNAVDFLLKHGLSAQQVEELILLCEHKIVDKQIETSKYTTCLDLSMLNAVLGKPYASMMADLFKVSNDQLNANEHKYVMRMSNASMKETEGDMASYKPTLMLFSDYQKYCENGCPQHMPHSVGVDLWMRLFADHGLKCYVASNMPGSTVGSLFQRLVMSMKDLKYMAVSCLCYEAMVATKNGVFRILYEKYGKEGQSKDKLSRIGIEAGFAEKVEKKVSEAAMLEFGQWAFAKTGPIAAKKLDLSFQARTLTQVAVDFYTKLNTRSAGQRAEVWSKFSYIVTKSLPSDVLAMCQELVWLEEKKRFAPGKVRIKQSKQAFGGKNVGSSLQLGALGSGGVGRAAGSKRKATEQDSVAGDSAMAADDERSKQARERVWQYEKNRLGAEAVDMSGEGQLLGKRGNLQMQEGMGDVLAVGQAVGQMGGMRGNPQQMTMEMGDTLAAGHAATVQMPGPPMGNQYQNMPAGMGMFEGMMMAHQGFNPLQMQGGLMQGRMATVGGMEAGMLSGQQFQPSLASFTGMMPAGQSPLSRVSMSPMMPQSMGPWGGSEAAAQQQHSRFMVTVGNQQVAVSEEQYRMMMGMANQQSKQGSIK